MHRVNRPPKIIGYREVQPPGVEYSHQDENGVHILKKREPYKVPIFAGEVTQKKDSL